MAVIVRRMNADGAGRDSTEKRMRTRGKVGIGLRCVRSGKGSNNRLPQDCG